MAGLSTLDVKSFVYNATTKVFATMFSMSEVQLDGDTPDATTGSRIVGSVGFAGDVMGNVIVNIAQDFARLMTAALLDMEVQELEGDEEVYDVIGELCNMIGGDLKSRLCDNGMPCQLSIPSITSGSDYRIESRNWARKEQLTFRYQQYTFQVEVHIKAGK